MKQTTNYNLVKPELTDSPPDITVMNPNWDKIDEKLKEFEEENNNLDTEVDLKANKIQEAWISITPQNGWLAGNNPSYRKTQFGDLNIRGSITSGTTAVDTVIFTLPVGYRPSIVQVLKVLTNSNSTYTDAKITVLRIGTDGTVTIKGITALNNISLDLSFAL